MYADTDIILQVAVHFTYGRLLSNQVIQVPLMVHMVIFSASDIENLWTS
jgi:hypothetical protein